MATKPEFAAHTPPQERSDDWHPLKAHLSKVARLAGSLANKFGAEELGYYAGLWHDLGKYNPKFQRYLAQCHEAAILGGTSPREKVPHASYGAKSYSVASLGRQVLQLSCLFRRQKQFAVMFWGFPKRQFTKNGLSASCLIYRQNSR